MNSNPRKLFSLVNIQNLFHSIFKAGSYNDSKLVCKDKILYCNKLLLSLTFPTMGELMMSVGEWVDHIILMPDFTSEDLLQTMEIFFLQLDDDVKQCIQKIDDETEFDTAQTINQSIISTQNIEETEEVFVMKEEMKVELVDNEDLSSPDVTNLDIQHYCEVDIHNQITITDEFKVFSGPDHISSDFSTSLETATSTPANEESNITFAQTNLLSGNHEKENTNARLYNCSKCGKCFSKKHYATTHCKPKNPWRCPKCSEVISHTKNIKRHIETCQKKFVIQQKSPKTKTTFTCDMCDKSFLSKCSMLRHKQKQHNVMEFKALRCESSSCQFTTNSKDQMKRHITIYHGIGPLWNCDQCEINFLSQNGLRKHKLATHRLNCEECTESFANTKQLRMHNVINHAKDSQGQDENANTETTGF